MLVFWRPDFKMYSAYMMKPTEASVPATDDHMTLLPSFAVSLNRPCAFA